MEQNELAYLNKNTLKLSKVLEISNDFLFSLQSEGKLLTSDIDDVRRAKQNEGNSAALIALFSKLKGRRNSYQCLLLACKEIENDGAVEILNGYYKNTGASNSTASNFAEPVLSQSYEGKDPVVGSDSCTVDQVVLVLKKTASYALFRENLSSIAMGLDVPLSVWQDIRLGMLHDKIGLDEAIVKVLTYWVANPKEDEAKLRTLIAVLKENRLKEPGQKLKSAFL